jgi:hypothetical protein
LEIAVGGTEPQWSMEMCNALLPFACELPACVKGR